MIHPKLRKYVKQRRGKCFVKFHVALIGYKKLVDADGNWFMCKLIVPPDTWVFSNSFDPKSGLYASVKFRAEYVYVHKLWMTREIRGVKPGLYYRRERVKLKKMKPVDCVHHRGIVNMADKNGGTYYVVDDFTFPHAFSWKKNPCSGGIHFYGNIRRAKR